MHISYYTIKAGLNPAVGFGYAGQNIVRTLQELGHKVDFANSKADFQLNLNPGWASEGPGIMDNPFSAQGPLLLKPNI